MNTPSQPSCGRFATMCTSALHAAFTAVLTLGFVLTVVAFCTPGWSQLYVLPKNESLSESAVEAYERQDVGYGLLGRLCPEQQGDDVQQTGGSWAQRCKDGFNSKPDWVQIVLALMLLALIAELFALAWNLVVCTACCCKGCLAPPLPIAAGLAAAFIALALVIFAWKHDARVAQAELAAMPTSVGELGAKSSTGYSLWLAVFADALMVAAAVVGALMAKTAKVSPL